MLCIGRRARCRDALRIENAVMAGTKETVILAFPVNLAPQMRTGAGKSDKVVRIPVFLLSSNGYFGSVRGAVGYGISFFKPAQLTHEKPAFFPGTGGIEKTAGKGRKSPVTCRDAGSHK